MGAMRMYRFSIESGDAFDIRFIQFMGVRAPDDVWAVILETIRPTLLDLPLSVLNLLGNSASYATRKVGAETVGQLIEFGSIEGLRLYSHHHSAVYSMRRRLARFGLEMKEKMEM